VCGNESCFVFFTWYFGSHSQIHQVPFRCSSVLSFISLTSYFQLVLRVTILQAYGANYCLIGRNRNSRVKMCQVLAFYLKCATKITQIPLKSVQFTAFYPYGLTSTSTLGSSCRLDAPACSQCFLQTLLLRCRFVQRLVFYLQKQH